MLFPTKKAPASEVSVSEQNKLSMWQFANLCTAKFRATETELCRTKVGTLTVCSLTKWNHRDFVITIPCGSDVWHLQKRIYMINGNRFHFLYFSWEYSEIRGGDIICPHPPKKSKIFFLIVRTFFFLLSIYFFPLFLSFIFGGGGVRQPFPLPQSKYDIPTIEDMFGGNEIYTLSILNYYIQSIWISFIAIHVC